MCVVKEQFYQMIRFLEMLDIAHREITQKQN